MRKQYSLKSIISIDKYLKVFVEIRNSGIFFPKMFVSCLTAISLPMDNYSYVRTIDFENYGKFINFLPINVALKSLSSEKDRKYRTL